jgi:hypothetical protein
MRLPVINDGTGGGRSENPVESGNNTKELGNSVVENVNPETKDVTPASTGGSNDLKPSVVGENTSAETPSPDSEPTSPSDSGPIAAEENNDNSNNNEGQSSDLGEKEPTNAAKVKSSEADEEESSEAKQKEEIEDLAGAIGEENEENLKEQDKQDDKQAKRQQNKENIEQTQEQRKNNQDVQRASSERREIIAAIHQLRESLTSGTGNKTESKKEDKNIVSGLIGSLFPGLLGSMGLLLPMMGGLLPIVAMIAGGIGLGKLVSKLMGTEQHLGMGIDAVSEYFKHGSITGKYDQMRKTSRETFSKDLGQASENIKSDPLDNSMTANTVLKTDQYMDPSLFSSNEVNEDGSFKDLKRREDAFSTSSDILEGFKNALDQYKGKVTTPGGRIVFGEVIKPYVKDTWPRYEASMKKAGLDPIKHAPGEFGEYAVGLEVLYNELKEGKSDKQVSRVAQVIAQTKPKNWGSMGVNVGDKKENITDLSQFESKGQGEVDPSTVNVNTESLEATPQQTDVSTSSMNSSESSSNTTNVMVMTNQSSNSPKSPGTPAPASEETADKSENSYVPGSQLLAAQIGIESKGATFMS